MKALWLIALVMIALLVSFVACNDLGAPDDDDDDKVDPDELLDDDDDDDATDDDDDDDDAGGIPDEPTWDNFVEDFFATYCTSCHGDPPTNSAPQPLVTYEDVKASLLGVNARVVVVKDMPTVQPFPTDEEREAIGTWIENGTPEE
jgi:hypothetical protein